MAFEKWSRSTSRRGGSSFPSLYMRSPGTISFSKGAREKWGLDRFKFITLWFDKEKDLIGLEFHETQTIESYPIRGSKQQRQISCKPFLAYHNLVYQVAWRAALIRDRDNFFTAKANKQQAQGESNA